MPGHIWKKQNSPLHKAAGKGLRELRKPSMSNELKPFIWDDYVYNQALRGNGAEHFNRTWTSSTERIALEEW